MNDDARIRPRSGVTAKQVERLVAFDRARYLAHPERLRDADGRRPVGSNLWDDKLVVLWPDRLCADTYVAAGLRLLRLAAITETENA